MSNLAHALRAPNDALHRELDKPWISPDIVSAAKAKATKPVPGVGIVAFDNAAFDENLAPHRAARRERIVQFHKDRDELIARAAAAGITIDPDKVVPTTYWHHVCSDIAGVFRLRPVDSMVHVSETAFADIPALAEDKVARRLTTSTYIVGALTVGIPALVVAAGLLSPWWLLSMAAAPMTARLAGSLAEWHNYYGNDWHANIRASVRMRAESRIAKARFADDSATRHMLWPKFLEPSSGPKLKVTLPEAPADVQETIVKAARAGFKMELAAAPEAISFADPVKLFLDERAPAYEDARKDAQRIADERAREREARRMMVRDPIATTSHGTATAILAQYGGEFPAEMKAINALVARPELLI